MDTSGQILSLDDFLHWNHHALGSYLSKRGLSKDGSKEELAALCFAASKLNLPLLPSATDLEQTNKDQYARLLQIGTVTLPDPFKLFSNWNCEKDGISKWPPIYITDITNFLMQHESKDTLSTRLNEYKVGKAYEYFRSNWLKEVFYHDISSTSEFCFLRANCTPSQKIHNVEHKVWICAKKCDGMIVAAYCTCTAGFGQTCNHIAGLLFRVEAANNLGITSSTSSCCTWNVPKDKTIIEPAEMKDLVELAKKSKHGRPGNTRPLVGKNKHNFEAAIFPPKEELLTSLVTSLEDALPDACFLTGVKKCTPLRKGTIDVASIDVFEDYFMEKMIKDASFECGSDEPEVVVKHLPHLSEETVTDICKGTFGQSNNQTWVKLRHGRITSSNFYNIFTRVESILLNSNTCVKSLLSHIMGYESPNPNIKSLKYGREMEPYAKEAYKKQFLKYRKHFDVSFADAGLFVDSSRPYIASTPDLLVSCKCCGLGMVEIKCCMIPPCQVCSDFCKCKLPQCLTSDHHNHDNIYLKKNHPYYGQIQGQLAITKRDWCDLFIHTCNGSFTERVLYDDIFYQNVLHHLDYFFINYVIPEALTSDLQTRLHEEPMEVDQSATISAVTGDNIYFCPSCNCKIKEPTMVDYTCRDQSIMCDKCHLWYHFTCVHMTKMKAKSVSQWQCPNCRK